MMRRRRQNRIRTLDHPGRSPYGSFHPYGLVARLHEPPDAPFPAIRHDDHITETEG
jgi:hypothetical protein